MGSNPTLSATKNAGKQGRSRLPRSRHKGAIRSPKRRSIGTLGGTRSDIYLLVHRLLIEMADKIAELWEIRGRSGERLDPIVECHAFRRVTYGILGALWNHADRHLKCDNSLVSRSCHWLQPSTCRLRS